MKRTHKSRNEAEKRALIKEYENTNLTMAEFCKKHGLQSNAIYSWRNKFKNNKTTQAKTTQAKTTQVKTPSKSSDLRVQLYNELKTQYEDLQQQLSLIYHRMQMIGENWDNLD